MTTNILMVCLGNICRSPLAEGILLSKVNPEQVFVDSAGTGGFHIGEKPDPRAIAVAKKYGIDISRQRCRKFELADFRKFDQIYVMDRSNYNYILDLATTDAERQKVKLLLEGLQVHSLEVPDPYFDGDQGFEEVYQLIDRACDLIVSDLKKFKK